MGKIEFLTDSGPIIHLAEIEADELWTTFKMVIIPDIVLNEVTLQDKPGANILNYNNIEVNKTNENILLFAKEIESKYRLGRNDSIIFAHSKFLKTKYIFTDDLELRKYAKIESITPVGTLGIILRSLRIGFYDKKKIYELIDRLLTDSSLFVTQDIIRNIKTFLNNRIPLSSDSGCDNNDY